MVIDCHTCIAAGPGCADCVVSVLLGPPATSYVLDDTHVDAVEALASVGLVPPLRLVPGGH